MIKGIVKAITKNKSFGFVAANQQEYFFHREDYHGHWNDLVDDYLSGAQISVTFDVVEDNPKGPRACNVRRSEFPNEA